jgi:CheY-like chemotaxis protein
VTSQRRLRVLVVDDDPIVADTIVSLLKQHEIEAMAVYSGEAAVREARAARPDVLLTDIVMQGMTGIEAAIKIQELYPNCRVLIFSGNPETAQFLAEAEAQGHSFEVLPKPLPPAVLIDRLSRFNGDSGRHHKRFAA